MKITTTKELVDNKYSAEFKTEFPEQENDLIEKFGDPEINFGGSFTGPPVFDLADHYRKMKSGLPYTYQIDANGDVDAKDKMLVWITEIRARLVSEINTLRSQTDDFTGEIIETV